MNYDTPHERYLSFAEATIGLRGRNVLEVGGSTPPGIALSYSPTEWTCLNLDASAVAKADEEAKAMGDVNYSARCEDITDLEEENRYDLVYSVNAFEHIHDLDIALGKMFRALKQGGCLFTLFGPIWSSDVGHHLSVLAEDKRVLHFLDGILEPWEHLTSTRQAIFEKLAGLYGQSTAQKAVAYIFDYHDLNRLFERDYLRVMRESGFEKIVLLRNKSGQPPDFPGATATRELLMVLKKGSVRWFEPAACLLRFAIAFGREQVRRGVLRRI